MDTVESDDLSPSQTLRINVTDAGWESLILRTLLRQTIPMLHNPSAFPPWQRLQLVQTLHRALNGGIDTTDAESIHDNPCETVGNIVLRMIQAHPPQKQP